MDSMILKAQSFGLELKLELELGQDVASYDEPNFFIWKIIFSLVASKIIIIIYLFIYLKPNGSTTTRRGRLSKDATQTHRDQLDWHFIHYPWSPLSIIIIICVFVFESAISPIEFRCAPGTSNWNESTIGAKETRERRCDAH